MPGAGVPASYFSVYGVSRLYSVRESGPASGDLGHLAATVFQPTDHGYG